MKRIIGFIVMMVVVLAFVISNYDNKCNISFFGLKTVENVPVWATIFVTFAVGLLGTIPFAYYSGRKKALAEFSRSAALESPAKGGKKKLWGGKEKAEAPGGDGEADS